MEEEGSHIRDQDGVDHYQTPSYEDLPAFDDKRGASKSIPKSLQGQRGPLN